MARDVHSSVSFHFRAATYRAYKSLRCLRAQLCDDARRVLHLSSMLPLYAYTWSIERVAKPALPFNWKPNLIHINHWNWLLFRSTWNSVSIYTGFRGRIARQRHRMGVAKSKQQSGMHTNMSVEQMRVEYILFIIIISCHLEFAFEHNLLFLQLSAAS